jgi:hypothetical protein
MANLRTKSRRTGPAHTLTNVRGHTAAWGPQFTCAFLPTLFTAGATGCATCQDMWGHMSLAHVGPHDRRHGGTSTDGQPERHVNPKSAQCPCILTCSAMLSCHVDASCTSLIRVSTTHALEWKSCNISAFLCHVQIQGHVCCRHSQLAGAPDTTSQTSLCCTVLNQTFYLCINLCL